MVKMMRRYCAGDIHTQTSGSGPSAHQPEVKRWAQPLSESRAGNCKVSTSCLQSQRGDDRPVMDDVSQYGRVGRERRPPALKLHEGDEAGIKDMETGLKRRRRSNTCLSILQKITCI